MDMSVLRELVILQHCCPASCFNCGGDLSQHNRDYVCVWSSFQSCDVLK